MKHVFLPLFLLTAFIVPAVAQPGRLALQASSTTAHAITGDVVLTDEAITFGNGTTLSLQAAAGPFTDDGDPVAAKIYRITPPADPLLLNANHLCGRLASFMVVWKTQPIGSDIDPRSVAIFSGPTQPATSHANGLCGIYNFEAAARK